MGYKEMYYHLIGEISDVIEILQSAMQETEEKYLDKDDIPITLLPDPDDTEE